jgi:hypothetical protein
MKSGINRFEALVVVQLRLKFCCCVEFEIQYGAEKNQEVKRRSQVVLEILHQLRSVRAVAAVQCIQLQNYLVNELFYIITLIFKLDPGWFLKLKWSQQ